MLTSDIKKQTSVCSFYFIKSLLWYFSNLEIWNHEKKTTILLILAYIAVRVLTLYNMHIQIKNYSWLTFIRKKVMLVRRSTVDFRSANLTSSEAGNSDCEITNNNK